MNEDSRSLEVDLKIDAAKNMLDEGVISLVDFERSKVGYQNAFAKNTIAPLAANLKKLLSLQFE